MTFLLLLFTGGCAFWDLKKRRIPNGMLLLGGLLFLLIRFGLGMKMGYTAGWDGRLPGYGAALMMGIGETCGYLIRIGSLLIVLFPLYLFRMIGAGDIKMAAVLFGAAGLRQGGRIFLCGLAAAGIWSLVLLIRRGIARQRLTYLVFYLYRFALGGKRRAVLSGSTGWKRGIFLSGTVPVFGSDWGGADSVSVRKMACD
ncbi:MAG: prepilin peptidase [Clostridia bacterium]